MTKKLIAFDLDDTLAVTKSPISERMAELLKSLLGTYEVCIISGGGFNQFKAQVLDRLQIESDLLTKLHLMPTCGTKYYLYSTDKSVWNLQYNESLSSQQKEQIFETLESAARAMDLWCANPTGEIIEDRDSQITFSALGQQATPEDKYAWSEKYKNTRLVFRDKVAAQLPELEVRIGGTTSLDITLPGVDKAYGMKKLLELTGLSKNEVLFIGDKLQIGGNDYPIKAMGIDSIEVDGWQSTARVIEEILATNTDNRLQETASKLTLGS